MSTPADLLSLDSIANQLERQMRNTGMGQDLHIKVTDPEHLIASLRAAAAEAERLERVVQAQDELLAYRSAQIRGTTKERPEPKEWR